MWRDPRVVALVVVALLVRLFQLPSRALWFDEAYSAAVAQQPLGVIGQLVALDVHPPLYYLLLHLDIVVFGDSLWALRGFSVLAGTAAVVVGACWTRLFASHRAMLIVLSLLALQPIAVRFSQEARMYALVSFWLMAASLVLGLWLRRPRGWRYPLLYALLATAALYTHYFAMTGIAAHWVYLLAARRARHTLLCSRGWWVANLAAALAFAPWLPVLYEQLRAGHGLGWIPSFSATTLPFTFWEFFWTGDRPVLRWPVLGVAVPLLLGWALWQSRGKRRWNDVTAIALLALLPLLLAALASVIKPLFMSRYLSFTALPMVMLLGLAIASLWTRHPRLAPLLLVAIVGLQGAGLVNGYRNGELINSPRRDRNGVGIVAEQVEEHWLPGDEIVSRGSQYLTVAYYMRRYPVGWLWLDGARPENYGAFAVLYHAGRPPWLGDYEDLPASTCGIWLFTDTADLGQAPPASQWLALSHRVAYDSQVTYYARRACLQARR